MSDAAAAGVLGLVLLAWIVLVNLIGMALLLIVKPRGRNRFGQPGVPRSPTDAVSTCLKHYAAANGRASRSEYWWFFLLCFAIAVVLSFLDNAMHTQVLRYGNYAFFLPLLTAQIRRLHDLNRSGWWVLLNISLVPVVLWVIYAQRGTSDEAEAAARAF